MNNISNSLTTAFSAIKKLGNLADFATSQFNLKVDSTKKIVIFGCGHLGQLTFDAAKDAGLEILAFADNNQMRWGQTIQGVKIFSPQQAIAEFNNDAFFVAAIYNGSVVCNQLTALGCKKLVPYPLFFWQFSNFMPKENRLELPQNVLSDKAAIQYGYELLSDEKSRQEYAAQIEWRCGLDYTCLPTPLPPNEMYYPCDLIAFHSREVYVDCGAFDGDSIRSFLDIVDQKFDYIYAIEPDPKNQILLEKYLSSRSDRDKFTVLPYGLSDTTGLVSFDASGTVGSRVDSQAGETTIMCRKLDDILDVSPPTFIKMDIEGAEPNAISGARELILSSRPILAVCAYHRGEHLWILPKIIKDILPEYNIFLRRYAEECWETVYYAIPPERMII